MLKCYRLPKCLSYTQLTLAWTPLPPYGVCNPFTGLYNCYSNADNYYNTKRKYHYLHRTRTQKTVCIDVQTTATTVFHGKYLARMLRYLPKEVNTMRTDVLEEVRVKMGHPNWLNMFKNSFLGVSVNTGPVDITNLLLSFVEHYFEDIDLEIECLIVLLLGSMSDKLAQLKRCHRQHGDLQSYSRQLYEYEAFRSVTNPGHVALANSLAMIRILFLLQQLATMPESKPTNDRDDGVGCRRTDVKTRLSKSPPCSKLDKVRILLSDLFIAAVLREAALNPNPLILQYSFQVMTHTIQGIFQNESNKNNTAVEGKRGGNFRENDIDEVVTPSKSEHVRRSYLGNRIPVTSVENWKTETIKFSNLLKKQALSTGKESSKPDGYLEKQTISTNKVHGSNYEGLKDIDRIVDRTSTIVNCLKGGNVPGITYHKQSSYIQTQSVNTVNIQEESLSAFMERRVEPQRLYGWGWTQELGVICQGCVALSGLGEDIQQSVLEFGRTILFIRQMSSFDEIDAYQKDKYLKQLVSYLKGFPDCQNKILLISLCTAYLFSNKMDTTTPH